MTLQIIIDFLDEQGKCEYLNSWSHIKTIETYSAISVLINVENIPTVNDAIRIQKSYCKVLNDCKEMFHIDRVTWNILNVV